MLRVTCVATKFSPVKECSEKKQEISSFPKPYLQYIDTRTGLSLSITKEAGLFQISKGPQEEQILFSRASAGRHCRAAARATPRPTRRGANKKAIYSRIACCD